MSDFKSTAAADAKQTRNFLHAFGAAHPFTFAIMALVIGGVIEHFLKF